MTGEQTPPAQGLSPEMFRAMIKDRSDEEILTGVKGNEETLLDGVFDAMKGAFDPSSAAGQSAIIQYDIDAPRGIASYQLNVDNGTCTVEKGTNGEPRVTMALNMPEFLASDGRPARPDEWPLRPGKLKITRATSCFPRTWGTGSSSPAVEHVDRGRFGLGATSQSTG